jgi:hypothetical protein
VQFAELENCLRMDEEELKKINDPENGKGKDMDIKSREVELVILVIRRYIKI